MEFRFPYEPYETQEGLMKAIYEALVAGRIGFFESPTGTGKTACLICAGMRWLTEGGKVEEDDDKATSGKAAYKDYLKRLGHLRTETAANRKMIRSMERNVAEPDTIIDYKPGIVTELVDELFADSLSAKPPRVLIFSSRTHSQLEQFVSEFKQTAWADEAVVVTLASKKQTCLHETVRRSADIEDACKELCSGQGCPYKTPGNVRLASSALLTEPLGLSDAIKACQEHNACPYFAAREALPSASVVALPYPTLLSGPARQALGLAVGPDTAVIIDEGHNLAGAVASCHDLELSKETLAGMANGLRQYMAHYRQRLTQPTKTALAQLLALVRALHKMLPAEGGTEQTVHPLDLGDRVGSVAWKTVIHFFQNTAAIQKIDGFISRTELAPGSPGSTPPSARGLSGLSRLAEAVSLAPNQYRVLAAPDRLRLILVDSRVPMEPLTAAGAVAIAGGTLSPIAQMIATVVPAAASARVTEASFPHVVARDRLFSRVLTAVGGTTIRLTQGAKAAQYPLVGAFLRDAIKHVPGGSVVFVPSYADLRRLHDAMPKMLTPTVWEHVDGAKSFETFQARIDSVGRATLFAVSSGRVSEGINFRDQYGRAVFMVGIPYPNIADPVLNLRKDHLGPNGGDYVAALAFRAVNQCTGRAIRHKNDYAAVVYVDARFMEPANKTRLSQWTVRDSKPWGPETMAELQEFYREHQ
ncbi:ATP-dependent RNA helicase [Carpediemonas membranifera]|uniref:ATP-dependent RNA helicase n=1 Tax=Carpediemonas membranifera TaxID=201153 RepID=A0A8J6DZ33_9EUKA|nr:ATP-dependent RNA helicase [Carpediemonas membranifera]|eukprot:KAG9393084.1 ATP-dependent RNA helicase [Carpediemonas membranifera]